jgi:ferritin-like metal-binding protein YciE
MGTISTPRELFVDKLADILEAENQIEQTLPKMIDEASDEELRSGLEAHLEQTRGHIENVEEVFRAVGESPRTKECHGIEGLKKEHEEASKEVDQQLLDSVVASSTAATEHYEISNYDTLITLARAIGERDVIPLLEENMKQDKETLREAESISKRLTKEVAKELAGT